MKGEKSPSLSPIHLPNYALTKREAGGWLGVGLGTEYSHKNADHTRDLSIQLPEPFLEGCHETKQQPASQNRNL